MQSTTSVSTKEQFLNSELLSLPYRYKHRFDHAADLELRRILFRSLAHQRDDYLRYFFPQGVPRDQSAEWSLKTAQGAVDGAEYTAAAKGTACGHIFRSGESTYHCKTCALDDTCVLCARCFDASDHDGHQIFVSVSPGNSGCCDCGDPEAWRTKVACTIHTVDHLEEVSRGKQKASLAGSVADLPVDLVEAIRLTIARAVDYLCDVFSCSPEQMRLPKTETGIKLDELHSRLSNVYGEEPPQENIEYALILWNDEKHTVYDVQTQVARACAKSKRFGFEKAMEVNDVGRSVIHYSTDLQELLRMAAIIEQIKVTVTIRSAPDTFREHMCEAIIDWIGDISGCAVGDDPALLRHVVCEELLKPWKPGSQASNKEIGLNGIDDHETEDNISTRRKYRSLFLPMQPLGVQILPAEMEADMTGEGNDDDETNDIDEDDEEYILDPGEAMQMDVDEIRALADAAVAAARTVDPDTDMVYLNENEDEANETMEATLAGYPPPPPPPRSERRRQIFTPTESEDGEAEASQAASNEPYGRVPRTPKVDDRSSIVKAPSEAPDRHWLEKPEAFKTQRPSEPCEDLWQRVRLDFLILYDLRLWKVLRIHLRHLYITTVVTIPHFKRILGLRFAGLYTALAQLYLIADREPDHSIINLSVQMLTTPTITQEVVERGNFLANLMAILYTFLTTRQVGFPEDVSPNATLAFDAGAVTNRRMFHFFMDLRWLFQSPFILYQMRVEQRYLLQFLDLVKLHQGVCPNVRATGEHVEYESDTWIGASLIVKEINKLCKQVAVAFEHKHIIDEGDVNLYRAIRTVAQVTLVHASGFESLRFKANEIKGPLDWFYFPPSGACTGEDGYWLPSTPHQTMSFHHPLHYLLSWLLETARDVDSITISDLMRFSTKDYVDPWFSTVRKPDWKIQANPRAPGELMSVILEHPLRVCVWLAQMKAGMWVRNGITLRHQAHTYRSVAHRDVGYQRDIFMMQAGFVLHCGESGGSDSRFLTQVLTRFDMGLWVAGVFAAPGGYDEFQQIDVFEECYHLLVIVLSERGNLIPSINGKEQHDSLLQHDIAHTLCFKPLSFSDLAARVTEKISESDDFNRVLETMTTFRAPDGLNDVGLFELKPEYIELVDPYYAHYSRNQREEAESIYKKHMARKTGKKVDEIVYEPQLQPIESGLFANLSTFTRTSLFARTIAAGLDFAVQSQGSNTKLQTTRIETFLHMVLHLVMIATVEDADHRDGFVKQAAMPHIFTDSTDKSVVSLLVALADMDAYASSHPTIRNILRKMESRQLEKVDTIMGRLAYIFDRTENNSPASVSSEDKERRKQEALARQARVMAQMKQQQNSFMQNQGLLAFEHDLDDLDNMSVTDEPVDVTHRKTWEFPTGACIWCQEETDDQRLYGTFAFLDKSNILRTTPVDDPEFVKEVLTTPPSLDRPADDLRPFGVAGSNKSIVHKVAHDGKAVETERQGLSKGFPQSYHSIQAPVATSCGHIMHYSCFELYLHNSQRRHQSQIARNHPENPALNEFTCPLCKALGNTFLPIIWKEKECTQEHELHAARPLRDWLREMLRAHDGTPSRMTPSSLSQGSNPMESFQRELHQQQQQALLQREQLQSLSSRSSQYISSMFAPSLAACMTELSLEASPSTPAPMRPDSVRRGSNLSRFFNWHRSGGSESSIDTTAASPSTGTEDVSRMAELMKAYTRLDDTVHKNNLKIDNNQAPVKFIDTVQPLSSALALSISAFEIAHRGVSNNVFATSLLADLSHQILTHLRIVSETIESYLAVNCFRPTPEPTRTASKTIAIRNRLTAQLLGQRSEFRKPDAAMCGLLEVDSFFFFIDWLTYMAPTVANAVNVLQLCYWAEMMKVALVYTRLPSKSGVPPCTSGMNTDASQDFSLAFGSALGEHFDLENCNFGALRYLVEKYALTFLRKCIVAMYVRYGLDFECPYNIDPETPELQRLTALLHLPSIDEMCVAYNDYTGGDDFRQITWHWLSEATPFTNPHSLTNSGIALPHPAIFELVGLPKNYDILTEEAIHRKCPTTGKEISDPVVCLLCGAIFCSQAVCCMKEYKKGGCYEHMQWCGGQVGIFINIRKCMVLFMHGDNGSFAHAPYLDRHGETDPTLRRHHQLFLNQKRYDKLIREVWLGHLIPTVISRKLEVDSNPGGWETL